MNQKLTKLLATGVGAGLVPKIPGTVGSLWGVFFFYIFHNLATGAFSLMAFGITLIGIQVATEAEAYFKEKDSQKIVIDEIAGQMICYIFVPYSYFNLIFGFLLFRLFDILKIFPAKWAQDNLKQGIGVMGDDVVAGIQAGLLLLSVNLIANFFGWF